jgi:hypothetical protein
MDGLAGMAMTMREWLSAWSGLALRHSSTEKWTMSAFSA